MTLPCEVSKVVKMIERQLPRTGGKEEGKFMFNEYTVSVLGDEYVLESCPPTM